MGKKRIMIIDDEKDFLKMAKLNLEETGSYEVMTESNPANAVKDIRESKPDPVLWT